MRLKTALILTVVSCFMLIGVDYVFSQGEPAQDQAGQEVKSEQRTQQFSGEVVSVDAQNKTLVLKHLDPETSQEQAVNVCVDEKTSYQNVESIAGINEKDNLNIDYIVDAEGKNMAKVVNLKKQEASVPETAPASNAGVVQ